MRTLISTLIILSLIVLFPMSASFARGGHAGHGHGEAASDELTDPRGPADPRGPVDPRGAGDDVVVIEDDDDSDEDDFDDEDNENW